MPHPACPGRLTACGLAIASGLLAPGAPVRAQTNDGDALQRVEITAEKRPTVLDTTPSAISVLGGGQLADRGALAVGDIAALVPNMSFTTGYGASQLFVRGIGNVFFTAGGDPGVALYADGSYVSDQTSANAALFDLQRVEVLRGPQGALYGRNATGGAVNLIAAAPTGQFMARLGGAIGQYGQRDLEGVVSGPLGLASTSARLSFQLRTLDGFVRNSLAGQKYEPVLPGGPSTVGPSRLDDQDTRALRLQTLTDLGSAGQLRLIVNRYREDDNGPVNKPLVDPAMIPILLYGVQPTSDPRTTKSQGAWNRIDVTGVQALYERPWGEATLSVSASHRRSRADMLWDGDATEALMAASRFTTRSRDASVDVHLTSGEGQLQWLVGATALRFTQKQDIQVDTQVPLGFLVPGQPLNVPFPGGLRFLLGGDVVSTSSALYGDLRYALSPRLALLAGLRLAREEKTAQEYQTAASLGLAGTGSPADRWHSTPGNLGLEYTPATDLLFYGRLSRGFKSGAINLGALQGAAVRPETVNSVEVGVKSSFAQRRASVSAALFRSRYQDMQVSQVGLASAILTNASSARIDGLELELALRPVPALTLNASLGLMDPRYTSFSNVDLRNAPTVAQDVSGHQLAQVSRQQLNLGGEFTVPLGPWHGTLRADYGWRSRVYFTEFNTADATQAAYGTLNLTATLASKPGGWKVHAQLLNAGDTTAITSMNISSPILGSARQVTYTPPRRLAVGGSVEF